jgi:RTX calcium-binding nonapeptide repeat (4 copies)
MNRNHARPLRRARLTIAAAALAVAALPAAAQAAEVTGEAATIVVTDESGTFSQGLEDNRLIVDALPSGELRLTDQVPLVVKTSACRPVTTFEAHCVRPSSSPIRRLVYNARGGDDQLRPTGSLPIHFDAGPGSDLYVGARSGAGTRVEFVGGEAFGGSDLVHYTNATTGVHVTKDGLANDGRPGLDRDNIDDEVEIITGTNFADRLVGGGGFGDEEEFRPRGGNDIVIAGPTTIATVDMGTAKDGADKIIGEHAVVSYAGRTNPIRASVGLDGADDGEAGEGDELVDVGTVLGGSGVDTLFSVNRRFGTTLDGGAGGDTLIGTTQNDRLTGGPGVDSLFGDSGADRLFTDDGFADRVSCGDGLSDVARTDTAELEIKGCETIEKVGTLALAPKALTAEAGETARLRMSWTHPESWRKLRAITVKLRTREGIVGRVAIRPRTEQIVDAGAVEVVGKRTRLTSEDKTVTARLALRLPARLAGRTLAVDVEATDGRGRRQLERDAGTLRIAE